MLWRRHHHHWIRGWHDHWRRLHHHRRRWPLTTGRSTGRLAWISRWHQRHWGHGRWKRWERLRITALWCAGWITSFGTCVRTRWWWLNGRWRGHHRWRSGHNYRRRRRRRAAASLLTLSRTRYGLNWRHLWHSSTWLDSCCPVQANRRTRWWWRCGHSGDSRGSRSSHWSHWSHRSHKTGCSATSRSTGRSHAPRSTRRTGNWWWWRWWRGSTT